MNPTQDIILIYLDAAEQTHTQPLCDIVEVGTLIDPETGDDMELVGWNFTSGQDYVLVKGGIVQNDPALPVFDLDVLDQDSYSTEEIDEVLNLYERMMKHHAVRSNWFGALKRAKALVTAYGNEQQQIELREIVSGAETGSESAGPAEEA